MSTKQPKSILKKTSVPAAEAGPSKPRAQASGSKLKQSVSVNKPKAKEPSPVPESDDDNDFGMEVDGAEGSEADTDDEISKAKDGDKKKGTKRKRSATTAETFGTTLTSLLAESARPKKTKASKVTEDEEAKPKKTKTLQPSSAILSMSHTKLPPSKAAEKLERKAKRQLKAQKEEKEDKARIRDVVEGWTAADGTGAQEFEKGLRKVAQRGVIRLFNAILVASKNAEAATTSLAAKAGVQEAKAKRKEKDNVLGRGGKDQALTQESFLDLVRKGTVDKRPVRFD